MKTVEYSGPKSLCTCGHTGDGPCGQHGPTYVEGHGGCIVKGCKCRRFTWAAFTPEYQALLDVAKAAEKAAGNPDETEVDRRALVEALNTDPDGREALEKHHGKVWDTTELGRDFEVLGFMAPFVAVRRKSDRRRGTLCFQHHPRFYFDFVEESQ
jgi:hypothetical protein